MAGSILSPFPSTPTFQLLCSWSFLFRRHFPTAVFMVLLVLLSFPCAVQNTRPVSCFLAMCRDFIKGSMLSEPGLPKARRQCASEAPKATMFLGSAFSRSEIKGTDLLFTVKKHCTKLAPSAKSKAPGGPQKTTAGGRRWKSDSAIGAGGAEGRNPVDCFGPEGCNPTLIKSLTHTHAHTHRHTTHTHT
jgi:hypothetical protein